jgi:uncharacterized protein (TIRG00374 family)
VKFARKLIRLAGPLLFLLILSRIDIRSTVETMRSVRLQLLVPALALYPCLILLKSWRWRILLRQQNIRYGLLPAFAVYNSALAIGYVTPGRLGEFAKALYLRTDAGVTLGQALSSVLLDRVLDLYLLLATAATGAVLFTVPQHLMAVSLAVLAVAALGPLLILVPAVNQWLIALVSRVAFQLAGTRYQQDLQQSLKGFQEGMEQLLTVRLTVAVSWTIVAYLVFFLQCYLIALALGLPLSFPYSAYTISLASLLALLPLSVSGLGVRDATFVALLHPIGITPEMAISYSLLFLLVFNVFGGAIGALAWYAKPLR